MLNTQIYYHRYKIIEILVPLKEAKTLIIIKQLKNQIWIKIALMQG